METAGVVFNDDLDETEQNDPDHEDDVPAHPAGSLASKSSEQLEQMLEQALMDEDYSRAAVIRDELNKRK